MDFFYPTHGHGCRKGNERDWARLLILDSIISVPVQSLSEETKSLTPAGSWPSVKSTSVSCGVRLDHLPVPFGRTRIFSSNKDAAWKPQLHA
jgi:hypothetical protein